MQHAGLGQAGLAQQRQGVLAGRTGVHDDRLAGLPGGFQVQAERSLLQLGGFRLIVVVQARFANGHHMRMGQFTQQPLQGRGLTGRQVERVHAHRAVDIGVTLAQRLDRTGILGTDADAQEMPYPTLAGRLQGGVEGTLVGTEIETVEVAMGIYEHGNTTHIRKRWKSTHARQLHPVGEQRFEQQYTIEVGLAQHLLALLENPRLDLEHLGLPALLRQVLQHLAHVRQA